MKAMTAGKWPRLPGNWLFTYSFLLPKWMDGIQMRCQERRGRVGLLARAKKANGHLNGTSVPCHHHRAAMMVAKSWRYSPANPPVRSLARFMASSMILLPECMQQQHFDHSHCPPSPCVPFVCEYFKIARNIVCWTRY